MPWKDNVYVPCWTMDDTDVWNFDTVLAAFLADGLERMRRISHGYPGYSNEESWDWQLQHHAAQFKAYSEDDEIDITESWLWLAYNHAALWD